MSEKHPPIPLQPNSCDCGLFLLHYVELIFRDPEVFLGAMLPDLSKWFNTTDIDFKREDIAHLIQQITTETHPNGQNVIFPKMRFPARRQNRSKSGPVIKQEFIDGVPVKAEPLDPEEIPLSTRRRTDPRVKAEPFDPDEIPLPSSRRRPDPRVKAEPFDPDEIPLSSSRRRSDPRLKKPTKGSFGELLVQKLGRAARFTGNYREPSPQTSRHTSLPESPEMGELTEDVVNVDRLYSAPASKDKISFQIKKKIKQELYAPRSPSPERNGFGRGRIKQEFYPPPQSPDIDHFKPRVKREVHSPNHQDIDDFLRSSRQATSGFPSLDDFTRSSRSSRNGNSSWESVHGQYNSRDSSSRDRRFTLRRNNEDTNPDSYRKRKYRDDDDRRNSAKSSREMYDMLMNSSAKKSRRMY